MRDVAWLTIRYPAVGFLRRSRHESALHVRETLPFSVRAIERPDDPEAFRRSRLSKPLVGHDGILWTVCDWVADEFDTGVREAIGTIRRSNPTLWSVKDAAGDRDPDDFREFVSSGRDAAVAAVSDLVACCATWNGTLLVQAGHPYVRAVALGHGKLQAKLETIHPKFEPFRSDTPPLHFRVDDEAGLDLFAEEFGRIRPGEAEWAFRSSPPLSLAAGYAGTDCERLDADSVRLWFGQFSWRGIDVGPVLEVLGDRGAPLDGLRAVRDALGGTARGRQAQAVAAIAARVAVYDRLRPTDEAALAAF